MTGMAKIAIEQTIEQAKDSRKDILQEIIEVCRELIDELSQLYKTGFSKKRRICLLEAVKATDYEDFDKISKSKVQNLIDSLETISEESASDVYQTILKCEGIDSTLTEGYYPDFFFSLERMADGVLGKVQKAIDYLEEAKEDFEKN